MTNEITIVTLVAHKGKRNLASRSIAPTPDHHASEEQRHHKKLSQDEAARKLAALVEQNMERKGLSEQEKNRRVNRFRAFVRSLKKSRRTP